MFNSEKQNEDLEPINMKHRKEVFENIYNGKKVNNKRMFLNPGFRGVNVMPYPNHVK
jgi:hypothetical protein